MAHRVLPSLVVALTLLPAAALEAQAPVTVDASVGARHGWGGGERRRRDGYSLDVLGAARLGRAARGGPVVALAAGAEGPSGGNADCRIGASGGCVGYFPAFLTAGALGGWEHRTRAGAGVTVRGLVGPTYFRDPDVDRGSVGVTARLDLALPLAARAALVTFVRGALLQDPATGRPDRTLGVGTAGVGLRVR